MEIFLIKSDKKTVFISGNFNILHPGHLRLLRFGRELGERLIVGVNSNSRGGKAIFVDEIVRLESLRNIYGISEIFLIDEPIEEVLARLRPDIVIKGKEHEDRFNIEAEAVQAYGGALIFSSGEASFSSVELIAKNMFGEKKLLLNHPADFVSRHAIKKEYLLNIMEKFKALRVAVVGDLIVDEYVYCDALGMSQEDPTIVVCPQHTERFIGGAGIVAAHAASLGATVSFYSVCGVDEVGEFAKNLMDQYKIHHSMIADETRPTTLKKRYRIDQKTMLRVSNLKQSYISHEIRDSLLEKVQADLKNIDLLIFSDFSYGILSKDLIDNIINVAKEYSVFVSADSQSSSQNGDILKFKNIDLITPTEREARLALRNSDDGLPIIIESVMHAVNSKNIILKMGSQGAMAHTKCKLNGLSTDQITALNQAPIDVAGAGDALLASASMAMSCGSGIWEALYIGSLAAAIQVSRVGNLPLSNESVVRSIDENWG